MPAIPFDDDYGYLTFTFAAPPGDAPAPPAVRVDLYEINAAYVAMCRQAGDGADPMPAWREYLYHLGFPPMSLANALHVVRSAQAEIDRLGKAAAGSGSAG